MSTPNSTIYVCSGVRLSSRYDHSIYFDEEEAQLAYFQRKAVRTFTAYSYIRKSWKLKLGATMEEANLWNYLFFQNGTNGKWWYYFITNLEYINDGTVELTLELDVLQTYLFDFNFLPCFIERQHTISDEIGEHTILENLELGDYIVNGSEKAYETYDCCILVQSTINPNTLANVTGALVDGVYSGLGLYAVDRGKWQRLASILSGLSSSGKIDAIVNMWMYPQSLVSLDGGYDWEDETVCLPVKGCLTQSTYFRKITDKLDGYQPKNNKLFCYPFNFLYVTNNMGASAVYKYERFETPACNFSLSGAPSPDAGVKLVPQDYNGMVNNYAEGLILNNFPTCAWNADVYKLWLAQNQNAHNMIEQNATVSFIAGAVTTGVSIATGGLLGAGAGVGAMYNGLSSIQSLSAAKSDKAIEPHQARGGYSTSVNFSQKTHTFLAEYKSINKEHAKCIDDYFTMYGYQVNRIDVPNLDARPAFTFTKTVGCKIQAWFCDEDVNKIQQIFDNGVTFWKDGDQIGNYLLNNKPV